MRGESSTRIIGIDPGLRRTGWGVIETDGVRLIYVSSGLITSNADDDLAYRLREIFEGLSSVIRGTRCARGGRGRDVRQRERQGDPESSGRRAVWLCSRRRFRD